MNHTTATMPRIPLKTITRTSMFTGQVHQMRLPVTDEMLKEWEGGKLIQRVMPHLTPSEREFLMTGTTDEEWKACMSTGEEEAPEALGGVSQMTTHQLKLRWLKANPHSHSKPTTIRQAYRKIKALHNLRRRGLNLRLFTSECGERLAP